PAHSLERIPLETSATVTDVPKTGSEPSLEAPPSCTDSRVETALDSTAGVAKAVSPAALSDFDADSVDDAFATASTGTAVEVSGLAEPESLDEVETDALKKSSVEMIVEAVAESPIDQSIELSVASLDKGSTESPGEVLGEQPHETPIQ